MKHRKALFLTILLITFIFCPSLIKAATNYYLNATCIYENDKGETIELQRQLHNKTPKDRYLTVRHFVNKGKKTTSFTSDYKEYDYMTTCPKSVNKKAKKISSSADTYKYKLVSSKYSEELKSNTCYYTSEKETYLQFTSGIKPYEGTNSTYNRYEYSLTVETADKSEPENVYIWELGKFDIGDYYEKAATGGCYQYAAYNPPGWASGLIFSDGSYPEVPSSWNKYEYLTLFTDDNTKQEKNDDLSQQIAESNQRIDELSSEIEILDKMLNNPNNYSPDEIDEQRKRVNDLQEEVNATTSKILRTCLEYIETSIITEELEEECADYREGVLEGIASGLIRDFTSRCAMLGTLDKWLQGLFNFVKIGAIVILVIMGLVDFTKAVASGKDDSFKEAGSNLLKRSVILVIIFVLPLIIEFILTQFKILDNNSNISQEESKLCDIK